MPTGYTANVADGRVVELRDFALICARAFGATVMQRDEPLTEEPRHRVESMYHVNALREAQAKWEYAQTMTIETAARAMFAERAEIREADARYRTEKYATRARYEAMIAQVETWEPPTPDHAKMKEFMAQQLADSMQSDCADWVRETPEQTPAEWLMARRLKALRDIAHHADEQTKEIKRCAETNAWIDALYASLPASAG